MPADAYVSAAGGSVALPRLVIAAPQGRSGKTTLSLGLCAALAGRRLNVQPFKKGPDYIDPSWLSEAAGRACRSLDTFFLPEPDLLRAAFLRGVFPKEQAQADFALIEGNHGLFDSLENDGLGSTAAVARILAAPVILVVNAARMGRSAAALVHGYQTFEPETPLAGVVLNNVANGRHEARLRQAIEAFCNIPVVGAIPRAAELTIPDRHLGLTPRGEDEHLVRAIGACRAAVEQYVDLNAVIDIARQNSFNFVTVSQAVEALDNTSPHREGPAVKVGVLRDKAFSFYYPENLEALEEAGAQLVYIDALNDARLPGIDTLYIGGGFPEMFMEALEANVSLRQDVQQAAQAGMPVYAECGGLMYLARGIYWRDASNSSHYAEMAGALPFDVEMTPRPQGHGYVLAECEMDSPFFARGTILRGHEFHHSRLVGLDASVETVLRLERGAGIGGGRDGLVFGNTYAGYTHLHAYGSPEWAPAVTARAAAFAGKPQHNPAVASVSDRAQPETPHAREESQL